MRWHPGSQAPHPPSRALLALPTRQSSRRHLICRNLPHVGRMNDIVYPRRTHQWNPPRMVLSYHLLGVQNIHLFDRVAPHSPTPCRAYCTAVCSFMSQTWWWLPTSGAESTFQLHCHTHHCPLCTFTATYSGTVALPSHAPYHSEHRIGRYAHYITIPTRTLSLSRRQVAVASTPPQQLSLARPGVRNGSSTHAPHGHASSLRSISNAPL